MTYLLLILTILFAIGFLYSNFKNSKSEKELMDRLETMLSSAQDGNFTLQTMDETKLSSIENQLARFIASCGSAVEDLEGQRRIIKSLITDISHQTVTPISNILLYTQLLSEELELHPDLAASCISKTEAINEQTRKLEFLIQSLVKMSRIETGMIQITKKTIPVSSIFEELAIQFQLKAEDKNISLVFEETSLLLPCDKKWTLEALSNLVDNAIKYTSPGGKVLLRTKEYPMFLKIDVLDTGIGIAEEEHAQIYERFYRSKEVSTQPGIGIGLALARDIVTLHHGYMKLTSSPGKGSCFSVFFPLE